MSKVLIAYNNDSNAVLHDFMEMCADEAKQICADNNIDYTSICPPNLNEPNVVGAMPKHQLCVIASHGDEDGVYNEEDIDVVSTHTTNYNFNGKGFYSIACSCAQNLYQHLQGLGLLLFVGYNDSYNVRGDREPFVTSALSGLRSFLSGDNIETAKQKMLSSYDEQIAILDHTDPMAAVEMVHNKEALAFFGENNLVLTDLQ
ncbi:MAG: hypothetical protein II670_09905 [Alphaproteobacteria bacterium]|nr:hypothetical protein [Alphaproteobacteria bacterium]